MFSQGSAQRVSSCISHQSLVVPLPGTGSVNEAPPPLSLWCCAPSLAFQRSSFPCCSYFDQENELVSDSEGRPPPPVHHSVIRWCFHPSLEFCPKAVSKFHLAWYIMLLVSFPSPDSKTKKALHTLDVRSTLLYYTERTKPFWVDKALLICYCGPQKGRTASSQSLSRWAAAATCFCYETAGQPYLLEIKAHSMRVQGSSAAFHRRIPLVDFCKAAM